MISEAENRVYPVSSYKVIYVDPTITKMTVEELIARPIPAADDSILFLWATSSTLKDMMDVLNAWGFSYSECAVWDRMDNSHPGMYFRNQHDILLVCIKGEGLTPTSKENSICHLQLKEFETKPEYYTEIIKTMFPGVCCLNLLADSTFESSTSEEIA